MPVGKVLLRSNIRDYQATFHTSPAFISDIAGLQKTVFIIDSNVWALHSKCCFKSIKEKDRILLPANEKQKSLATVESIYDKIMRKAPKKNINIISVGGGIVQDVTGFVASTLYRGVNWLYVPTTLLAQADSCIGAKTSLNYKSFKNLIGTFYPPSNIYIYPHFLTTLDEGDFLSGVGEIVKLHILGSRTDTQNIISLLPSILKKDQATLLRVINRSLRIKKGYIEKDEFDAGIRNMLNFGHCFGHAIETATDFKIPHGKAVVIGILLANIVAVKRGLLSSGTAEYLNNKLLLPLIKADIQKTRFKISDIINAMKQDKKRTGKGLALVMLVDGNKMKKETDISDLEAKEAIAKLIGWS